MAILRRPLPLETLAQTFVQTFFYHSPLEVFQMLFRSRFEDCLTPFLEDLRSQFQIGLVSVTVWAFLDEAESYNHVIESASSMTFVLFI